MLERRARFHKSQHTINVNATTQDAEAFNNAPTDDNDDLVTSSDSESDTDFMAHTPRKTSATYSVTEWTPDPGCLHLSMSMSPQTEESSWEEDVERIYNIGFISI